MVIRYPLLDKVADIISFAHCVWSFKTSDGRGGWGRVHREREGERCSAFAKENSFVGLDASGIKKPCD